MAAASSIAIGAMAAGGLMSASGSAKQGAAAQEAGIYNQVMAEENAKRAIERAKEDERQFRISVRHQQASNRAAVAKSGVKLEGSPMEVLRANARKAEEDAIAIRMSGFDQAQGLRNQGEMEYRRGRAAFKGGQMQAYGQLLSTGGAVAGKF